MALHCIYVYWADDTVQELVYIHHLKGQNHTPLVVCKLQSLISQFVGIDIFHTITRLLQVFLSLRHITFSYHQSDLKKTQTWTKSGMPPWWPLLGLLSWCPICKSSQCNSFEDQAPVDFIYGCPIFKMSGRDLITWEGTRRVTTTMAAGYHAQLLQALVYTYNW